MLFRSIEKEIEEKQRLINNIKSEDIIKVERLKEKINNLTEDAKQELTESKGILEKEPIYLVGRLSRYRNLFDKTITVDEFKILLNNIKK